MEPLDPSSFSIFLLKGEKIIHIGAVWKRRHFALSCQLRVLILTSKPRLMYIDHKVMELKGEIPWDAQNPVTVVSGSKPSLFDVISPLDGNRAYHFEAIDMGAQVWETKLNSILDLKRVQESRKGRVNCALCHRGFGLLRSSYSCRKCSRAVCAECSEAALGSVLSPSTDIDSSIISRLSSDANFRQSHAGDLTGALARLCQDCSEDEVGGRSSAIMAVGSSRKSDTSFLVEHRTSIGDDSRRTGKTASSSAEVNQRAPFQASSEVTQCNGCEARFGLTTLRQNHCRSCGLIYCKACSSATFPLKSYGMYPQRVCDECAWSLSRHTAKENAWPLCHLACVVLCWSQCCPTVCARWFVTTSDAVSGLRQAASPFGPLWGHFSLDFLLPGKEGGGDASSTAGDTSTGL